MFFLLGMCNGARYKDNKPNILYMPSKYLDLGSLCSNKSNEFQGEGGPSSV